MIRLRRPPHEIEHGDRHHDTERDGQRDERRHANGPKKEEQHERREKATPEPCFLQAVDRIPNQLSLIEKDVETEVGPGLDLTQLGQDLVTQRHDVGLRLAEDPERHGRTAVQTPLPAPSRDAVGDVGDISEPDPAMPTRNHDVFHLPQAFVTRHGPDVNPLFPLLEKASAQREVVPLERPHQRVGADAARLKPLLVDDDEDFPWIRTPRPDSGDTVDPFERSNHLRFHRVVQILEGREGDADPEDGVVRLGVVFPDADLISNLFREIQLRAFQTIHHLVVGQRHVGASAKGQTHRRAPPGVAAGSDSPKAFYGSEVSLERAAYLLVPLLRRGVGVVHTHPEGPGLPSGGEGLNADTRVGDNADREQRHQADGDRDRAVHGDPGQQVRLFFHPIVPMRRFDPAGGPGRNRCISLFQKRYLKTRDTKRGMKRRGTYPRLDESGDVLRTQTKWLPQTDTGSRAGWRSRLRNALQVA